MLKFNYQGQGGIGKMEFRIDEKTMEDTKKTADLLSSYTERIIQEYSEKSEAALKTKLMKIQKECNDKGLIGVSDLLDRIIFNIHSEEAFEDLINKGYSLEIIEPQITEYISGIEEQMEFILKNTKVKLTRTIVKTIAEA